MSCGPPTVVPSTYPSTAGMRVLFLVFASATLLAVAHGIKCRFNYGAKTYGYIDCPGQQFCLHADLEGGYKIADCGRSSQPLVRRFLGKAECDKYGRKHGETEDGHHIEMFCCMSDYCNSAPQLASFLTSIVPFVFVLFLL
ncbi:hypothetical protein QR680_012219 [Steinernema hermaphroditum]|uniref:Activin types I and II receptor domain-containing protein n=1 Tax=Steinernema hermaphroditum TaxID=289476 RepID=A0AA39I1B7_9BILA|nr:hypothetical protein QR680_012219 [Steinernema hermaphroditum]